MDDTKACEVCGGWCASRATHTYFVRRERWIKIGSTSDPAARIKRLASPKSKCLLPAAMDSRAPLETVLIIPKNIEHELHERYADDHEIGEWFQVSPALIDDMPGWIAYAAALDMAARL